MVGIVGARPDVAAAVAMVVLVVNAVTATAVQL